MSSVSDSASLSSPSNGSDRSGGDRSSQSMSGSRGQLGGEGRIPMETTTEIREDLPEELAKSNWQMKAGYGGVRKDIVALERVSVVDYVCHGKEGAAEKFFYMYMCHFSQLFVRLPFDDFTMRVLRLLNVTPTQLHPNNWAYLQAFQVLCQAFYLQPSSHSFMYFFDTRPKSPTTWLLLISRSGINKLDAFTQSFNHFKDDFFKVVVKEPRWSYFYNDDGNTIFPFSWTGNPSRYKDMKREKLWMADREVVDTPMNFNDNMPTKGLVRVYNLIHPIVDVEGHIAQVGKKNLNLFQALPKEKATKARATRSTKVPNLQDLLVEVHVHGGSKRKADEPVKQDGGKDVKRVRVALLGPRSSTGVKKPEVGLIELLETLVRCDININLSEALVNSIDNMEPNAMIMAMLEFNNKALILGRRVGSLYQRELKEGNRSKVEEFQGQVGKHVEEKAAWEKEREEWLEEKNRLGTWKVRCLEFEKKLKGRIANLEANYDELKEKHDGLETELEDLKSCFIQEHINGFHKGLSEVEISPEEKAEKMAVDPDANTDEAVVVEDVDEGKT
ncbi:hypothetical protein DEO72_LG8g1796 [Vigna unguiculata]|uniref:Transposase (putative) gypsy type domain-containing protein n=1 Tax=Vigna unguiculata TaxID=3917 RepID=A0A4D6MQE0_VIGUN|nr:hypothetical protein DEO72_LG8g1796 [Vigna unguiculata]